MTSQNIKVLNLKTGPKFDQAILEIMLRHKKEGLNLAKKAQDQAQDPYLKDFIEKLIPQQQNEINQLSSLVQ